MSAPPERSSVTTLELFFDLVFVFTITQLTNVFAHEPTWEGLFHVAVLLGLIFWMYGGYAWLTNAVALDRVSRRLWLLAAMAALLVVALAVPTAFTGSGATFGMAYLAVVLIHMGLFARSSHLTVVQAMRGLAPFNLLTALLVLAGGIAGGTAEVVLWTVAVLLEWVSPKLIDDSGFVIAAGHFVERHGLVVIVALGESVVAVGIGAEGLPVDAALVAGAVLGLALAAALWWSYFGDAGPDAAERALAAAPQARRPRMALEGFGYWHLPILLGVVLIAAALKHATGHPFDALDRPWALALGGGAAVFLAGEALFRRTLRIGGDRERALAAVVALLTIPIGTGIASAGQVVALLAVFVAMLVAAARVRSPVART
jgi:low temperature requirement protein LtrA